MDRRPILLPLALLLAGCGGLLDSTLPVDEPALGAASMDLALSGGPSDSPKTMRGTGSARGEVRVGVTPTGNGVATTEVRAVLASTKVRDDGRRLTQTLLLHLNDPATLVAGATFALDGTTNSAEYRETLTWVRGAIKGDSVSRVTAATAGTVEVASLTNGVATLRLANASFAAQGPVEGSPIVPVLMAGTLSGKTVYALDD